MSRHEFEQRYLRWVIGGLSAYEAVAIVSRGAIPTITGLIKWTHHQKWGRPVLWGLWGYATVHFFESEVQAEVEARIDA